MTVIHGNKIHQAADFLHGVVQGASHISRVPEHVGAKLPVDTCASAAVPAGVHLAMQGDARAIDVTFTRGQRTKAPSPEVRDEFDIYVGTTAVGRVGLEAGIDQVRIELPVRRADDVVRIYVPETLHIELGQVAALDGAIMPAAGLPRWVIQGDSITQGWSASAPGLAWPARIAREVGANAVNLGFAGSARGELMAAVAVSESQADAVTLAWGTNCWTAIPTDAAEIAQRMRVYLTVVRQGLPDVPIQVISPIIRPGAEQQANRLGATLVDLRAAIDRSVREFAAAHGDGRLSLVHGLDLLGADGLVDGVHPGDIGHAQMADSLVSRVRHLLSDLLPFN